MTYRDICYDILTNLKSNFSDAQFSLNSIFFWVRIYADRLRIQHDQKIDSGAYSTTFVLNVLIDSNNGRQYVIIPSSIYDYDNDKGVEFISYYHADAGDWRYVTFTRTSIPKAKRLFWTEDELPTPSNPYWYRDGEKLFLIGTECIDLQTVEAGLKLTLAGLTVCDLDEQMPFPDELIPILQRQVLDLGRFILSVPVDRTETQSGDEPNTVQNKQKLVSVQDFNNQQTQE